MPASTAIILKEEGGRTCDISDLFLSICSLRKLRILPGQRLSGKIPEENAEEAFLLLKEFLEHNIS